MRREKVPPGAANRRRRSRGITFTEIMIASAIMAAAFIPIVGYMRDSMRQERYEKMEAGVASYVNGKMNEYLVTKEWSEVASGSGTDNIDYEEAKIQVEWTITVTPVMTGSESFNFDKVNYHSPCSSMTEAKSQGDLQKTPAPQSDLLQNLDKDSAGNANVTYLKEIKLMVRWAWPGEPYDDARRRAFFVTRRAYLQ